MQPSNPSIPSNPSTADRAGVHAGMPVVAIIGRPNVGKSTLFNRILGRREAIVEDVPGTTRDRIYTPVEWDGVPLLIVDTGGIELDTEADIGRQVTDQAAMAIQEADIIVFLVDVIDGVTPADQDVANLLRQTDKPVFLVANKAENRARELAVPEFFTLGLDAPIAISAHHGTGIGDLMDAVVLKLPRGPETIPSDESVKVAIAGRPNVGKSALVNAILGEERVMVSPVPGTTRDAIDTPFVYQDAPVTLIDTAGIRRSGRVNVGVERYSVMRSLRAVSRADIAVLLVDATEGLTAQDLHIAGYIREAYKGLVVAVNKWDLAGALELDRMQVTAEIQARLKFFPDFPLVIVSAKTGMGIPHLLTAVMQLQQIRQQRVPTGALNQFIQRVVMDHPPAMVRGKRLKVLYATQAETMPPTFVFFVNDPAIVHFSYQRYIENRLRQAYGFAGVSIKLILKGRQERE